MKITKVHLPTFLVVAFILGSIFTTTAQKVGGFYDKLYEFSFPYSPAPNNAIYYKKTDNLKSGRITMKDYRGEMVTVDNFNHKRPTYNNNYRNYSTLLTVLRDHDDLKSNKTNTVYYNLNSSDIELYYKKGESDSIYDVFADFTARYDATFQGKTISKDSIIFKEKVGEIESGLKGKDFAIVAVNRMKNVAYDANDQILVSVHNAYQGFVRRAQMYYGENNVAFFKLRKTKKLSSEQEINTLTEAIRNLHAVDTGFEARTARNKEIEQLIEKLNALIGSVDYKEYDDYKIFVHGNLGALYSLLEEYVKGITQYDLGDSFEPNGGVGSYLNNGKRNAEFNLERKQNLFLPGSNTVKPAYSENYTKIYLTNKL